MSRANKIPCHVASRWDAGLAASVFVEWFSNAMRGSVRLSQRRLVARLLLITGLFAGSVGEMGFAQSVPIPDRGPPPSGAASGEERKSPALALGLSVGGTAVPLLLSAAVKDDPDHSTLAALGVTFGPSLGNYYAEHPARARRGLKIRGIGAGITGTGLVLSVAAVFGSETARDVARGTIGVGLGTVAVGAVYDIATAPLSAVEYNETHDLKAQVRPAVGARGEQVGLALEVEL